MSNTEGILVIDANETAYHHILLPVFHREALDQLTGIVCTMLHGRGALSIIQIVEVPSGLSMNHARELKVAHNMLSHARACAEAHGVSPTARVIKTRSAAEAILETAAAERADLVVLGFSPRRPSDRRRCLKIDRQVRKRASCDVVTLLFSPSRKAAGRSVD